MRWLAVTTLALFGCRDGGGKADSPPPSPPPANAVQLEIVDIDASGSPARGRPFVAGEALRIELRATGGTLPYSLGLALSASDSTAREVIREVNLEARQQSPSLLAAVQLQIPVAWPSGQAHVNATVRDRDGKQGTRRSDSFAFVGQDAPLRDAESPLHLLDAGGRRRAEFHCGERVTLRSQAAPGESGPAALAIVAADGTVLADGALLVGDDASLNTTFEVPPLALPGDYTVRVSRDGREIEELLRVAGPGFPAVSKLTIDELALRAGDDGRSPRHGVLFRGEDTSIEVRVAGMGAEPVSGSVRLEPRGSTEAVQIATMPERRAAADHPTARIHLAGNLALDRTLLPGKYLLRAEVSSGDVTSERYREVLVK